MKLVSISIALAILALAGCTTPATSQPCGVTRTTRVSLPLLPRGLENLGYQRLEVLLFPDGARCQGLSLLARDGNGGHTVSTPSFTSALTGHWIYVLAG
jgi:hypothetical protein